MVNIWKAGKFGIFIKVYWIVLDILYFFPWGKLIGNNLSEVIFTIFMIIGSILLMVIEIKSKDEKRWIKISLSIACIVLIGYKVKWLLHFI